MARRHAPQPRPPRRQCPRHLAFGRAQSHRRSCRQCPPWGGQGRAAVRHKWTHADAETSRGHCAVRARAGRCIRIPSRTTPRRCISRRRFSGRGRLVFCTTTITAALECPKFRARGSRWCSQVGPRQRVACVMTPICICITKLTRVQSPVRSVCWLRKHQFATNRCTIYTT